MSSARFIYSSNEKKGQGFRCADPQGFTLYVQNVLFVPVVPVNRSVGPVPSGIKTFFSATDERVRR